MNRRRLLHTTALAGLGVLAGCATADRPEGQPAAGPADRDPAPARPDPAEAADDAPGDGDDTPAAPEPDEPEEPEEPEPEEAAAPAVRVEVLCRDGLGLAAAAGAAATHRLDRVTLHHTAVRLGANHLAPARLRGHQRYHLEQGWSDIAYHYAVDLRGNVYELRDPTQAGDTFTDYDPAGHLLVVCEGDYDVEHPTDDLLDGVARLLAVAADVHGVDPRTLTGHRDHATGVACPGEHLQASLPQLRQAAADLGAQGPGELREVCGDEARARVADIEDADRQEVDT